MGITRFLGMIIQWIYEVCGNYGVAIILFTLFTKILLLPLGIKQQKSMAKTQALQPKLLEIQQKYKNDKERQSRETMALYQKYNASPMSGCLPLIVQLVIIICLVNVIYNPAKYVLGLADVARIDGITKAVEAGMNFNFLTMDLSLAPSAFGLPPKNVADFKYWIIPILATLATWVSGKLSQTMAEKNKPKKRPGTQPDQTEQMTKSMNTFMPIMTLIFTYSMPVTASLYWFVSSAFQVIQQFLLGKFIKADIEIEETSHNKRKG